MNTMVGCAGDGASQPKEPVRLIDANELLKHFNTYDCAFNGDEFQAYKNCMMYVRDLVDDTPTIDPETLRPTAQWVEAPDEGADGSWEACSSCAWESRWAASKYKYCPHCGKRMVNAYDWLDKR